MILQDKIPEEQGQYWVWPSPYGGEEPMVVTLIHPGVDVWRAHVKGGWQSNGERRRMWELDPEKPRPVMMDEDGEWHPLAQDDEYHFSTSPVKFDGLVGLSDGAKSKAQEIIDSHIKGLPWMLRYGCTPDEGDSCFWLFAWDVESNEERSNFFDCTEKLRSAFDLSHLPGQRTFIGMPSHENPPADYRDGSIIFGESGDE